MMVFVMVSVLVGKKDCLLVFDSVTELAKE